MPPVTYFPEEAASSRSHVRSRSIEVKEGDLSRSCSASRRHVQAGRYNLRSRSLEREVSRNQKDHVPYKQVSAMNLLLAPHYVTLAFNLPPGSSTIWRSIEEDIMSHCDANCPPSDKEDLASFLLRFFSPHLVDTVRENLTRLADSFLGIQYTLRLGKASLASTILEDMMHEYVYTKKGPLAGFLGDSGDADNEAVDTDVGAGGKVGHEEEGWQEYRKKKGRSLQRSSQPTESGAGSLRGQGGGRGRRGRGGAGGRGRGGAISEEHFTELEMVEVLLPGYKTRPKVFAATQVEEAVAAKRRRDINIGERSLLFRDHPLVHEGACYNPEVESTGRVHLFHGTRAGSLGGRRGFRSQGIKPFDKANEFCADEAFYISNSVRHAYEHPLHHHPSKDLENPIVVFVFDIDVEVLHANKPPPGSDDLFKVIWFEEPNHEWEKFCRGNMNRELPREDADIVIGPICKVKPPPQRYEALKVELEGGVQLTQIAFCSTRAWKWLAMCAIRMYSVRRSQNV
ncbi:hypothetical protein GOP47_0010937 [Adiantum capillus-veneris]|uniref:Uncharacterized protein n=1 Tax=Adiantum capillus-veneris TaxID=13818 RepID=A0A9D4UW06_ADICA|nr:hypothetical protein GOP47_0010937 [Adiantum capillus-veneris]